MQAKQRFYPQDGYVPMVYGYCRVSHASQLGDKDATDPTGSLPDQEKRIRDHYAEKSAKPSSSLYGAQWATMYREPKAQSAYSKPMQSRIAGKQLIEALNPTDHIIVDKLDRMFRSQFDFVTLMRWFDERCIHIHFVDFNDGESLDSGSHLGRFIIGVMAMFAEMESANTSRRITLARSQLRAAGRDDGARCPFYMEVVGCEGGKTRGHTGKRVLKPWALPLMEKLAYANDTAGLGPMQAAREILKEQQYKELGLTAQHCWKLYKFYVAWNAAGRPDPSTLKVGDFVKAYWTRKKGEAA